jgi:hypothetical protein
MPRVKNKIIRRARARRRARAQVRRRGSGFFYTPFLSRFYGIQFYGFRVRAVQDSWFAVHARIACMTDGQSVQFARTTPRHCVRSTHLLGSPAAIPCTSPPRIRRFVHGAEIIYLINFFGHNLEAFAGTYCISGWEKITDVETFSFR